MTAHYSKVLAITIAAFATAVGAECVRAAVNHHGTINTVVESHSYADLPAAEMDPVFGQKLAQRMRGSHERAHSTVPQT